jgi:hypothetical protein
MEGCKRRELRAVKRDVAIAWHVANFGRAGKDFKNLDHYLGKFEAAANPKSEADQAAAIFTGFEKRGLAKIRERKRDGG